MRGGRKGKREGKREGRREGERERGYIESERKKEGGRDSLRKEIETQMQANENQINKERQRDRDVQYTKQCGTSKDHCLGVSPCVFVYVYARMRVRFGRRNKHTMHTS